MLPPMTRGIYSSHLSCLLELLNIICEHFMLIEWKSAAHLCHYDLLLLCSPDRNLPRLRPIRMARRRAQTADAGGHPRPAPRVPLRWQPSHVRGHGGRYQHDIEYGRHTEYLWHGGESGDTGEDAGGFAGERECLLIVVICIDSSVFCSQSLSQLHDKRLVEMLDSFHAFIVHLLTDPY